MGDLAWRMMEDGYLMQINQLRNENTELRILIYDILSPKYDKSIRMTLDEWNARDLDILKRANKLGIEI